MDFDIIIRYVKGLLNHDPVTPALDKVISGNVALIVMLVFILVLIVVGRYAMGTKIFGKNKAWKAIIPFYGLMELYRVVDVNPWFAIAIVIPVLGLIPFFIFCFKIPKAFGQKIDMQILTLFLPYVMFSVLGFSPKYEYQYKKGKSTAFKDEFRTVMPEDADMVTPAGALNGASVSSLGAKESAISRAASAAAEQTRLIREEQEKAAAAEAQKKKEQEEEQKKATKKEDFDYDIFNEEQDDGPDSSSIDFNYTFVNGKFRSAPEKPIESVRVNPAQAPVPQPAPVTQPTPVVQPAPAPIVQPAPAPIQQPAPAPQPVQPTPVAPQPAPAAPEKPASGIEMTTIPPSN